MPYQSKFPRKVVLLFVVIILLLWPINLVVSSFAASLLQVEGSGWFVWPDGPGTLGDSYGALTSLLSAASFVAVLLSMYLQRKDAINNDKALREQLWIERRGAFLQTLPFFIFRIRKDPERLSLINLGSEVYDIDIINPYRDNFGFANFAPNAEETLFNISLADLEFNITVTYTTKLGEEIVEEFHFPLPHDLHHTIYSKRKKVVEDYRLKHI